MNLHRFTRLRRGQAGRKPTGRGLFQPGIHVLEERTLLTTVVWMIRPTFSSVALNPSLDGGGNSIPITEQGAGSLTTGYAGRMKTDVDLTNNTIQFFTTATIINARNSGSWQPDVNGVPGSSPANYGGQFEFGSTNYVALRDMRVTLSSPVIPLTPTGGGKYTFPADEDVNVTQANLDYQINFAGSGRASFTGSAANDSAILGTLQVNPDGSKQLTVPVKGTTFANFVEGYTIKIKFDGVIGGIAPSGGRGFQNPRLDASIVNLVGDPLVPVSVTVATPVDAVASRSVLPAVDIPAQTQEAATVTPAVHHGSTVAHDLLLALKPILVDPMQA